MKKRILFYYNLIFFGIVLFFSLYISNNVFAGHRFQFPENYNDMSESEKVEFWNDTSNDPTGMDVLPNYQIYFNENMQVYSNYNSVTNPLYPTFNWEEAVSPAVYLARNVTLSGNTAENSDDLQIVINNMITDYNNEVGYTVFYYPSAQYINPDFFTNHSVYDFVKNTVSTNPDWYFKIFKDNNVYCLLGTKIEPLGVVMEKSYWSAQSRRGNMYNNEWNTNFEYTGEGDYLALQIAANMPYGDPNTLSIRYCQGYSSAGTIVWSDEVQAPTSGLDMDTYLGDTLLKPGDPGYRGASQAAGNQNSIMDCTWYSNYGIERAWVDSTGPALGKGGGALFHGASGLNGIEVYPTLNALKKGTIGLKKATYGNDYTGTCPTSVPANFVINNNIGGSVSGVPGSSDTDDSGGGSSGSGWLDKIIEGLGSVGNAILSIVGSVIEWIGKAIEFITDSLGDITDLVTGNTFSDFLAQIFPYVPEEIWSGVILCLALLMFGGLIRFFKG